MTTTISLTTTLDDCNPVQRAALATFMGGPTVMGAAPVGGSVPVPATPAPATPASDPFFPPHAGDALFPSPENSTSTRVGAEIQGAPYLRDVTALILSLCPVTDACPQGFAVNGTPHGGGYPGNPWVSLIVRQGKIIGRAQGGQLQFFDGGMGSTYNLNADLPEAWVNGVAPPPALVVPPSKPEPYAVAPGSSGRTLEVGPGKPYTTMVAVFAAAQDGDTILVTGDYHEKVPPIPAAVVIRSVSGSKFDATGLTADLAYGKGLFVGSRDYVIDGLEVFGVALDQGSAQTTCAVRPNDGCGHVTVIGCNLHDNQCGVGGGAGCVFTVRDTTLADNGLDDGFTHDVYIAAGNWLVIDGLTAVSPKGGHAVKSRAHETSIANSHLAAVDATVVDIPDGSSSPVVISNTTLTKPAGAANHALLGYGMESGKNGLAGLSMASGVIDCECDSPLIQCNPVSTVTIGAGVVFKGPAKPVGQGGKVVGLE